MGSGSWPAGLGGWKGLFMLPADSYRHCGHEKENRTLTSEATSLFPSWQRTLPTLSHKDNVLLGSTPRHYPVVQPHKDFSPSRGTRRRTQALPSFEQSGPFRPKPVPSLPAARTPGSKGYPLTLCIHGVMRGGECQCPARQRPPRLQM